MPAAKKPTRTTRAVLRPGGVTVAVTGDRQIATPALRRIARAVLSGEGVRAADLSVAFVNNPTIHALNRQFLGHDRPTDVVTFPLSDAEDAVLSGEIVISTDTAREVARELGHSLEAEIALYLIHGLLHLCGYDDRTAKDRKAMRARERCYLRQLEIPIKDDPHYSPRRTRRWRRKTQEEDRSNRLQTLRSNSPSSSNRTSLPL